MAAPDSGTFTTDSVIRGYHEYRSIWEAAFGEVLQCQRERANSHDPHAVAVVKDGNVVGHVPRKLSAICAMFLHRGGSITCQVNGRRQYSRDLPQGGLEVPCMLTFCGVKSQLVKVQALVKKVAAYSATKNPVTETDMPCKKIKIEPTDHSDLEVTIDCDDDGFQDEVVVTKWICIDNFTLSRADKDIILNGEYLSDKHINASQKLLAMQFPTLTGFSLTFKQRVVGKWMENYVQILHCRGCHLITISTIGCQEGTVNVYDSLFTDVDDETQKAVRKVFNEATISFSLPKVQRQKGTNDCGLFAIAFATKLCFSHNPVAVSAMECTQCALRAHLITCLENAYFIDFP